MLKKQQKNHDWCIKYGTECEQRKKKKKNISNTKIDEYVRSASSWNSTKRKREQEYVSVDFSSSFISPDYSAYDMDFQRQNSSQIYQTKRFFFSFLFSFFRFFFIIYFHFIFGSLYWLHSSIWLNKISENELRTEIVREQMEGK